MLQNALAALGSFLVALKQRVIVWEDQLIWRCPVLQLIPLT